MKSDHDKQLEEEVVKVLNQSVDELDDATSYRLQMARAKVLSQAESSIFNAPKLRWLGVALASLFVVSLVTKFVLIDPVINHGHPKIESSLFEDESSIEFYEEYEFYVWLSERESQG